MNSLDYKAEIAKLKFKIQALEKEIEELHKRIEGANLTMIKLFNILQEKSFVTRLKNIFFKSIYEEDE